MKLIKFDSNHVGARSGKPTISFGKAGCITISKSACEQMEIKPADKISFFQDETETTNWFVSKDTQDGIQTRENSGGGVFL